MLAYLLGFIRLLILFLHIVVNNYVDNSEKPNMYTQPEVYSGKNNKYIKRPKC